ncbi:HIRAN domain-containing protein [Sphingomonas sp. NFX23]|uniref:HIRAN domain-containing protein n=1 Tax=Sphingomonas sp. NFX23 TaxID=2819532 RepID=UPI003CF439D0
MLYAPGNLVELRLEPTNPFDANAVAIFSDRGTQLGYVSAERAALIGKRMGQDEVTAVFQAMHGNRAYIRIRFGGGLPTLPDPVPDVPKPAPPR